MEGRGGAEGTAGRQSTVRTLSRDAVSQALARVREAAKRNRRERFTSLMHHLTPALLAWAFHQLKPKAAPGVDGVTWAEYAVSLDGNIDDLHRRVMRGAYRAKPSRRQYIPKPDGRQRPLGIAAMEDKIVQRAMVEVLNAIYETDFLGFSYGFRPGRSQHDALDALAYGINLREVNWVLDADIRSFFDCISHQWMMRFLEHRICQRAVTSYGLVATALPRSSESVAISHCRLAKTQPNPHLERRSAECPVNSSGSVWLSGRSKPEAAASERRRCPLTASASAKRLISFQPRFSGPGAGPMRSCDSSPTMGLIASIA